MAKVKILNDCSGCNDGIFCKEYKKGSIENISDSLFRSFKSQGFAESFVVVENAAINNVQEKVNRKKKRKK